MPEDTIKKYRVEVKARLSGCPRCGGWVALEPDPVSGAWKVCVNCGWQEELKTTDQVVSARKSY